MCFTHRDDFHGPSMVSRSWIRCLYACAKEVFYSAKHESGVIDSVDLYSKQLA